MLAFVCGVCCIVGHRIDCLVAEAAGDDAVLLICTFVVYCEDVYLFMCTPSAPAPAVVVDRLKKPSNYRVSFRRTCWLQHLNSTAHAVSAKYLAISCVWTVFQCGGEKYFLFFLWCFCRLSTLACALIWVDPHFSCYTF